ncbi:MAG: DNRLRE domain-containing protein [Pseudomonadota bacterium]|nr:DNRLRE domain-containing protein [Pseudomonadota bacterium]
MRLLCRYCSHGGFVLIPVILTLSLLAAIAFMLSRQSAMNAGAVVREHQTDAAHYTAEAGLSHLLWQVKQAKCSASSNLTDVLLGNNSYSASITATSISTVSIKVVGTQSNGANYKINRDQVKLYQSSTSTKLVMGDNVADKSLSLDAGDPWRTDQRESISVYASLSGPIRNGMLYFDLSGIPSGVKIISAQLELFVNKIYSPLASISVHRVQQDWAARAYEGGYFSGGATWNNADDKVKWVDDTGQWIPGGAYDIIPVASSVIAPSELWGSWSIETLVSGWVNGAYPNQGLLLKGNGTMYSTFYGKESNVPERPRLTIIYACECGQICITLPS